jgi:hypothetical protein
MGGFRSKTHIPLGSFYHEKALPSMTWESRIPEIMAVRAFWEAGPE